MRWSLLLVASIAGCGGSRAEPRDPSTTRAALEDLKAQVRRERRTIRSLENEVALLRARLRDTPPPPAPAPPAGAVPPASGRPASAPPPAAAAQPEPEPLPDTLGEALYGEVEIVYEGEAAEDTTVRPRLELHESSRRYAGTGPSDAKAARAGARAPAGKDALPPVPRVDDRLPVMSGEIPTVASQLRRARRAPGPPPATTRAGAAARAPATATATASDPRADYKRLVDALRAGNHEYAAAGLRSFLDLHPRHDLADNAQYWLAESYYARKRYRLAIVEFQKVVDRYPRGNKVPDAMLKIG
ncbi:MAG TPA: tetratricopeptide repeat protein, partial [Kofleriaceae bacterium]|nr:tetratricopeptide repeat protein [Kofleriaceae bacterium]